MISHHAMTCFEMTKEAFAHSILDAIGQHVQIPVLQSPGRDRLSQDADDLEGKYDEHI